MNSLQQSHEQNSPLTIGHTIPLRLISGRFFQLNTYPMDFKRRVQALSELISNGDTINAIELFYADHVEVQENEHSPRIGKSLCLEEEINNLKKVRLFKATLLNQAIDVEKCIVFSEWLFEVTRLDSSRYSLREVSVQQWQNGLVVKEQFYYNPIENIKTSQRVKLCL